MQKVNWREVYEHDSLVVDTFCDEFALPNEDVTILKFEYKRLSAKYIQALEQNMDVSVIGQELANVGQTLALYEIQKNGGGFFD
jgi:hypothetical protein